jgi:hypothetical protein
MKRVFITRTNGTTAMVEMEDPTLWIEDCIEKNVWGLPERDELDQDGNPTGNLLPAEYTIEIVDITTEHALRECIANRKMEYPTPEEFMNAFFDGGDEAISELQAKRLAIKAKYPKP